jgi:hypothetical protein
LATDRIVQIGLMIADRQAGRFRLEIAWLSAYAHDLEARRSSTE